MKNKVILIIISVLLLFTACEKPCTSDFYIIVNDAEGTEKVLYYLYSQNDEPAFIYMSSNVEDAEEMMGYVSIVSENLPAAEIDMPFGASLEKIISDEPFTNSYISYNISEGTTKYCPVEYGSSEMNEMIRLIASAEPEFIPIPENSGSSAEKSTDDTDGEADEESEEIQIDDTEGFYEYDARYPIRDLVLRSGTGNISTALIISFGRYNDRLAVRFYLEDYSELDALAKKGSANERKLRAAFKASSFAESEWFYADSIEGAGGLYDLLLKTVIMSEKNELPNVRQYRTEKETLYGFSGDIAEFLYTDTDVLTGFAEHTFNDEISFMLPDGNAPKTAGNNILMWDNGDVKMMIRADSDSENAYSLNDEENGAVYEGNFGDKWCFCRSRYEEAAETPVNVLYICGRDHSYTVKITAEGAVQAEEYDKLCRSIFGSFRLLDEEVPESAEDIYGIAAPITLSDEPSRFSDEGYKLAEAVDYNRYSQAVPQYQAYVPRIIAGGFYSLDFRNKYETKFDCSLEKLESDGKWYEVLPVNEAYEVNGDKWFDMPDVFDEARQVFTFDLEIYPPLPEGRYRVVKPIRRSDTPSMEYGAFMEFDMVHTGEKMNISAVCTDDSFSKAPKSIDVKIKADFTYAIGENYDIEYYDGEKWSSVRKSSIPVNSVGVGYSVGSREFLTEPFDLSCSGRYRLRIAVSDFPDGLPDEYAVVYAEFSVGVF